MNLSISTGSFYSPKGWIGTNRAIRAVSKLGLKNIELCLISFDKFPGFNLPQAKKDLKKFKVVGIHLPSMYYQKDAETQRAVDYLHYIYWALKANYVVVHRNWVKNPYFLKKKPWLVLVENDTGHHKTDYKKFGRFIKKHRLNMLLDVNHASDYGLKEVSNYVKHFKNKIKAVHLAGGHQKKSVWHRSFSKASEKLIKSFEPIKRLDALIVLEDNKLNVKKMKKELQAVKKWFGVNKI